MTETPTPSDRLASVCRAIEQDVAELAQVARRQHDLRDDIDRTRIHVEDIRHSRTWRVLEIYRKARVRAGLSGLNPMAMQAAIRRRRLHRPVPKAVREGAPGVNVAGYLDAESGMGEAARASVRSLQAVGIPVALNRAPSLLRTRDVSYRAAFVDDNPYPFNLVHLNGDNMPAFAAARGRRYFRDHYTIGYWFWELSTLRDDWAPFAGYVDEVWTATRFVQEAVRARCAVPVVRMPLPIVLPALPPHGRAHFGIPEGPRVFLYIFDVSSQTERKNPLAAVRAFRRAALPHDAAVLVLKFTNPEYDRAGVRRLHEEAAGLNVVMLDGYFDRPDLCALINAADCYLSPHRSEGFGLTLLEAMSLGKPLIGTAYSGNMDFMTAGNSYLLDYSLVTLTRDYGPYLRGSVWAEPDVDHAARLIREVTENAEAAAARGAIGRADVERDWNPDVTGRALRHRLDAIREGRRLETEA